MLRFHFSPNGVRSLCLLMCSLVLLSGCAVEPNVEAESGDAWRSVLYPQSWQAADEGLSFYTDKFIQDFSLAGYRSGREPVPDIEGPVFTVTDSRFGADPGGVEDSTEAIQKAIDAAAAAGGGVVYLPAGTYLIAPAEGQRSALLIRDSGIVLRGAGREDTFVVNTEYRMRSREVIRVEGPHRSSMFVDRDPAVLIRRNVMGPSRWIPVEDTNSFSSGDRVVLRMDITEQWIQEHNELNWSGLAGEFSGLAYPRRIVSVDHGRRLLEIDIPVRYALKTRDNARVHPAVAVLTEVGLEDFSIGNREHPGAGWENRDYLNPGTAAHDVHQSYLIAFTGVENSWIRRVSSFRPSGNTREVHKLSNGVLLHNCRFVSIEEVEMQRVQYGGWGGNGYNFRLQQAADNLIKDSLAAYNRHGFVFSHMATSGNVIHNSVDRESGIAASGRPDSAGSDHHMHFSHSNLIDLCRVENSFFDARYRPYGGTPGHNISSAHSVFWNIEGSGDRFSKVVRSQQARYGYVIGTHGEQFSVDTVGELPQTDPLDHVEGVGRGDSLQPQSLYLDQVLRRCDSESQRKHEE